MVNSSQKNYYQEAPFKHYAITWTPSEKTIKFIHEIISLREKGLTWRETAERVNHSRVYITQLVSWYKQMKGGDKNGKN